MLPVVQRLQLSRRLDISYLEVDDLPANDLELIIAYLDGEGHGEKLKAEAEAARRPSG